MGHKHRLGTDHGCKALQVFRFRPADAGPKGNRERSADAGELKAVTMDALEMEGMDPAGWGQRMLDPDRIRITADNINRFRKRGQFCQNVMAPAVIDHVTGDHNGLNIGTLRMSGDGFKAGLAPMQIGCGVYSHAIHPFEKPCPGHPRGLKKTPFIPPRLRRTANPPIVNCGAVRSSAIFQRGFMMLKEYRAATDRHEMSGIQNLPHFARHSDRVVGFLNKALTALIEHMGDLIVTAVSTG